MRSSGSMFPRSPTVRLNCEQQSAALALRWWCVRRRGGIGRGGLGGVRAAGGQEVGGDPAGERGALHLIPDVPVVGGGAVLNRQCLAYGDRSQHVGLDRG